MMLHSMTVGLGVLFMIKNTSALVASVVRAPTFVSQSLGTSTDNFAGVTRDGGGGGVVNGKNIAVFSDTTTTRDGKMIGFTSNSAVFVCFHFVNDFVEYSLITMVYQSNHSQPLQLEDFGSNGVPKLAVPWEGSETDSKNYLWPCSAFLNWKFLSSRVEWPRLTTIARLDLYTVVDVVVRIRCLPRWPSGRLLR